MTIGLLAMLGSASAASAPTVAGTWSCCGSGGAAAQVWTITEESGGVLSGSASDESGVFSPIYGKISGTSVEIVTGPYTGDTGYTATFIGTISGETMSGTWSDTYGRTGESWSATRTSGSPAKSTEEEAKKKKEAEEKEATKKSEEAKKSEEEKKEEAAKKKKEEEKNKRPTDTAVSCYYEFLTSQDTCTAQVADAGAAPVTVPTGTVHFTINGPGGFPFGSTCSLAASAAAPTIPFCSVILQTLSSELPGMTAVYSGDATHAGSEGHTQFLGAGLETPKTEVSGSGKGKYPGEVSLETDVPVKGTALEASLAWQLGYWQIPPPAESALGKAFGSIPNLPYEDYQFVYYHELRLGLEALAYSNNQAEDWAKWDAKYESAVSIASKPVSQYWSESERTEALNDYNAMLRSAYKVFEVISTINATPDRGASPAPAKGSIFTADAFIARHKRAKRPTTVSVTRLASLAIAGANQGKIKLRLHIDQRVLARRVGKRREITVSVWLRMLPPASVDPLRVPLIEVKKITLRRRG